jgi:hypothetical protein
MKAFIFFLTLSLPAHAGAPEPELLALPTCINNSAQVNAIIQEMRRNPRNSKKYDGYRRALSGESGATLLARLAYAETLATNCGSQNQKIGPRIADSIANRARIRGGNVASVVFERDQYASSLNAYSESRYRDFLCPKNAALWITVSTQASKALEEGGALPRDAVNYYLFRHSTRFSPPGWAVGPNALPEARYPGSEALRACIRFYRNARWR